MAPPDGEGAPVRALTSARPLRKVEPDVKADLRTARTACGLTQQQVAAACGVKQQKVGNWESRYSKLLPNAQHLRSMPLPMRRHLRALESARDRDGDGLTAGEGLAVLMRECAELLTAYSGGMADGVLDRQEAARVLSELRDVLTAGDRREVELAAEVEIA